MIDEVRIYNTALTPTQIQTDQTTPITPTGPDTTPPTQPGTLSANAISAGEVDLAWGASSDNVGVTGYQVERCLTGQLAPSRRSAPANGSTTTYEDTHRRRLAPATATASAPPTPPTTSAPTPTPPTPPPPTPDTTPPTQPGTLSANAVAAERGRPGLGRLDRHRRRHRLPGRALPHRQLHLRARSAPRNGSTTTYKDTTVAASTGYSYRVRATDAAGNLSPYTNTANATTPRPPDRRVWWRRMGLMRGRGRRSPTVR